MNRQILAMVQASDSRARTAALRHTGQITQTAFGTVLGHHTAAELRDLLAAKDFENAKMLAAFEALGTPAGAAIDWKKDWDAYQARYTSAKAFAASALKIADASGLDAKNFPVEDAWIKVLQAETQVGLTDKILGNSATGPYRKGDKQDLYNRLAALRSAPVDFTGLPQPIAGTDTDLNVYKSADKFLDHITPPDPKKNPLPYVLGGMAILGVGYVAFRASPLGMLTHAIKRR